MKITSQQNPKIKNVIKLRKKRERDQTQTFFIEGYRELFFAKQSQQLTQLFFCPELFLGENEQDLIDFYAKKGADIFECTKSVFQKLSFRDGPDGLLGVAQQNPLELDKIKVKEKSLLVVVESIEKPGNLGTILRTCDGFNIDALICTDVTTDPFNPNVVRASTGTLFTVPISVTTKEKAFEFLQKNGVQMVATTPQATQKIQDFQYTKKSALIFGSEQYGLSSFWLDQKINQAKIEMHGKSNSFNVAISCAICLYEARRS